MHAAKIALKSDCQLEIVATTPVILIKFPSQCLWRIAAEKYDCRNFEEIQFKIVTNAYKLVKYVHKFNKIIKWNISLTFTTSTKDYLCNVKYNY